MKTTTRHLSTAALAFALLGAAPTPTALAQSAPPPAPLAPATPRPAAPRSQGAALAGLTGMLVGAGVALGGVVALCLSMTEPCDELSCPNRGLTHVGLGLGLGGAALTVGGMLLLHYGASPAPRPRASLAPALLLGPTSVGARWSF
jgi:hypothetical protein